MAQFYFSRTSRLFMPFVVAILMLNLSAAQATKPLQSHMVIGCVVSNKFVPYREQKIRTVQKVPYWVRHVTKQKLEGKELRLNWASPKFSPKDLDNYCFKNTCSVKVLGPCDRSRLID